MATRHVVVDGSNIATEGRSMPSLAQLDQAVREFLLENPTDVVTVVVDASFGHRIDASELDLFEGAEEAGELVSPPAGAIGRGDAFLLRIADKTGATVLSNDSFQEFHGDYEWLFERGRLIGGKPVPGVGWIFTPRTPVRGPRSREAVQEAKRKKRASGDEVSASAPSTPGLDLAAERARGKGKGKKTVERAIAVALEEVVAPKGKPRRRTGGSPPAEPVNDPLTFITFIAAHPLGTEVTATVESFASHGAFVEVGGARCYVPLSAMGDPPPKSAREVFAKGEPATFVIQALDPQRRGIELALPLFAKVAGAPTAETVEAEIEPRIEPDIEEPAPAPEPEPVPARARKSRKKAALAVEEVGEPGAAPGPAPAPVKKSRGRRVAKSVDEGTVAATEAAGQPDAGAAPAAPPAPRKRASAKKAQPPGGTAPASKADAAPAAAGKKAPAPKRSAAKKVAAPAPVEEAPAVGSGRRKRAPAKAAQPLTDPSGPEDDQADTTEQTAVRSRAAARKARSEAATSDDEQSVAFRTAGRKRAPAVKAPSRAGRGGGRGRAAGPAVAAAPATVAATREAVEAPPGPPAPLAPAASPPVKRTRARQAGPAKAEPVVVERVVAEPVKATRAKRSGTKKATPAPADAAPAALPGAAATKAPRRRASRVAAPDETKTS